MEIKDLEIGGYSAVNVRDALRRFNELELNFSIKDGEMRYIPKKLSIEFVASSMNICLVDAKTIMDHLVADNYIDSSRLIPTSKGMALCAAEVRDRLALNEAKLIVDQFLLDVVELNSRHDARIFIEEVYVFGSYRRGELTVGDIDLLIIMPLPDDPLPEDFDEQDEIIDRLMKSDYLSLHGEFDLVATSVEKTLLYKRNLCYLTGIEIKKRCSGYSKDDWESLEHIIPNAIGGKIASRTILTEKSNNDLNNLIDIPFNKSFESYVLRMDFKRDRKTNPQASAFHNGHNIDIVIKDDRFYPRKPFFDKNKKSIYCDSINTGEIYKKKLIKDGLVDEKEDVKIFDDLDERFVIPFSCEEKIFKQGFAKIAAGFASHKQVRRKNLRSVINLASNKFHDRIIVASALPSREDEFNFEIASNRSGYYPVHAIVLHASKKEKFLYCYVELFSTFQWYVLLDDEYDGDDIFESYAYDIMGDAEISYEEYLNSIPAGIVDAEYISAYRKLSRSEFYSQRGIDRNKLKKFNHLKFYMLSEFCEKVYLSRKLNNIYGGGEPQ